MIKGKIREGLDRVNRENPEANWTSDNDETIRAEQTFDDVVALYVKGDSSLADVKDAFHAWEAAFLSKPDPEMLFK